MRTPETIKAHASDYKDQAWRQYSIQELGNFVHLLVKRSSHRAEPEKRKKDLYDARNYLAMIEAHISEADGA